MLVWILVSLAGMGGMNVRLPTVPIATFADRKECERVREAIRTQGAEARLACVQARVVRAGAP